MSTPLNLNYSQIVRCFGTFKKILKIIQLCLGVEMHDTSSNDLKCDDPSVIL